MANSLINRLGPTFVRTCMDQSGAGYADVVRAYLTARDSFSLKTTWADIEALDNKVSAQLQTDCMREISQMMREASLWFIRHVPKKFDIGTTAQKYNKGLTELFEHFDHILSKTNKTFIEKRTTQYVRENIPQPLALRLAYLPLMVSALDVVWLSQQCKVGIRDCGMLFYGVGHALEFEWLRIQANGLLSDDHWHNEALRGLIAELNETQTKIAHKILNDKKYSGIKDATERLKSWIADHNGDISQTQQLVKQFQASPGVDISMLAIASQRLRGLV